MFAHNHPSIDFVLRAHKQGTPVLKIEDGIGNSPTLTGRNQGTITAALNAALMFCVTVVESVHHTRTPCIGKKFTLIANQSTRWGQESDAYFTSSRRAHVRHDSFAQRYFFDHCTTKIFIDIDKDFFYGFQ